MKNGNKNIIFIEANVVDIYAKFQLHSPFGFRGDDFSPTNFAFQLPWQPIRFSSLDKIHTFGTGLLKDHFCNIFVKISAMR